MHYLNFIYPALLATTTLFSNAQALRSGQKIKLSNVKSLTLRSGQKTSHRRVPAIPQLNCVGGSAKGLYEIDVLRCENAGSDYDSENIQWTCTASLPEEFKLGSTDVICEGYDSPDDPYVLKGSCGVEYKLMLTSKGEDRYPGRKHDDWGSYPKTAGEKIAGVVFWCVFIGVLLWIVYSAISGWATGRGMEGPAGGRPGWGGGGGGGWGGWGGDGNDPPPPYDYHAPKPRPSYGGTDSWRPGFWSGAMGGAAAGYYAGRSSNRSSNNSGWGRNNGEGSSRSSSGSSSGSPSYSSTRHESTGYGSTSRR